jgi:hypothetical protein
MPADLKKVAKEIENHLEDFNLDGDEAEQFIESRLSEVRAQAMEEAANIADEERTGWMAEGIAASCSIARAIRRRASGKEDK